MTGYVKAREVFEVCESRWSGDEYDPIKYYSAGTFTRYYKAKREADRLQAEHDSKEGWKDNVRYYVKTRLVKAEEADGLGERPDYFTHFEEVEPIEDTCGEIREVYRSDKLSLAHVRLSGKAKKHLHHAMEEVYYITRGDGYLTIGDERYPIEEGDTIGIPKDVWHYLETEEGGEMELIAVTHPRFNLDDVITEEPPAETPSE